MRRRILTHGEEEDTDTHVKQVPRMVVSESLAFHRVRRRTLTHI
jgi:hypothetical protein